MTGAVFAAFHRIETLIDTPGYAASGRIAPYGERT
jgi:hypothetical protein